MNDQSRTQTNDQIAKEAFAVLGTGEQTATFSSRYPGFDLADAYDVAARVRDMRIARGENVIGRKIGFTNRAVWSGYGISGPIWNYMFDSTVGELAAVDGAFVLADLPEPRIEPEIAFRLATAPHAMMSDEEIVGCIDWVAHGFEIVHSIFPGWAFKAADAVAAYGVHSGLLIGEKHAISEDPERWTRDLLNFTIELVSDDGVRRDGHARNVLGGPVRALRSLVEELARYPNNEPLRAGEVVTTGTLTEAMPVAPGQTWSTHLDGIDVGGLRLRFR
jgi:2-oxo-3-hexenedioate decarboxylase